MVTIGTTMASSTLLRKERMKVSSWNSFWKLSRPMKLYVGLKPLQSVIE